jgi:hypothetical protein
VFVDPVADIAVLGSPQDMPEQVEAYDALTNEATTLEIGILQWKASAADERTDGADRGGIGSITPPSGLAR